jgi:hypothetical protein
MKRSNFFIDFSRPLFDISCAMSLFEENFPSLGDSKISLKEYVVTYSRE